MPEDQLKNQANPDDNTESTRIPDPPPENEGHLEENSIQKREGSPKPDYPHATISPNEERTWAMLAHLSVLLNLVTGFFGGIAAIIIYFVYKDRSRLVAYHAMQAFIFQTITWLGAGLLAGLFIGVGSAFAILILPLLCLLPGFLLLLLIPISLIYGVIGGVKVNNGEDFRYWQVGEWVRYILEPKPVSEL
jgi:hypothetical protein